MVENSYLRCRKHAIKSRNKVGRYFIPMGNLNENNELLLCGLCAKDGKPTRADGLIVHKISFGEDLSLLLHTGGINLKNISISDATPLDSLK